MAWFWRVVWWWKCRTGFVRLGPIVATGTILSLRSSKDGDALINIAVDDPKWCPAGMGDPGHAGRLHCELVPWNRAPRAVYATLAVGDRVRVTGEWGFDGVHALPDKWPWWTYPLEVLLALWRHQPNFRQGWFEVHPVTGLERL